MMTAGCVWERCIKHTRMESAMSIRSIVITVQENFIPNPGTQGIAILYVPGLRSLRGVDNGGKRLEK